MNIMKYIKKLEDYKIKSNFNTYHIFPDFFKGELFDYYQLLHGVDNDILPPNILSIDRENPKFWEEVGKYEKQRKKLKKKRKKEILGYINDYNQKIRRLCSDLIEDFDFVTESVPPDYRNFKIKTISIKNRFGTYKLKDEDFEDLTLYLSDPELYLNTKKYNI